jgi:hypothetical protein
VKIFCNSAESANQLILEAGHLKHLGSNLKIHKDIKAPSTCNRCQLYGHISAECSDESPICARCAGSHHATDCTSSTIKCTPCGSGTHQTNDASCPERKAREDVILTKSPEALSPYYITHEPWTWGLSNSDSNNHTNNHEPTSQEPNKNSSRPPNKRQRKGNNHTKGQQTTLFEGGIQHQQQLPTGSNNTPIGMKKNNDQENHTPTEQSSNAHGNAQPPNTPNTTPITQPTTSTTAQ